MADRSCNFKFKKPSRKVLRKRHDSGSDEDATEESMVEKLHDVKELQKLRKRAIGVSDECLNVGKQKDVTQTSKEMTDPFKLKSGGIVEMSHVKAAIKSKATDDDMTSLGTTFSAETNRRDEDVDMIKYVEQRMQEIKGKEDVESEAQQDATSPTGPKDALFTLPEKYLISLSKKTEETMSNQMLSGIPEFDLGIESKIANIEATEEAKAQVIRESLMKKEKASVFVPVNMAVNFVQHSRWKDSDDRHIKEAVKRRFTAKVEEKPEQAVVVIGGTGEKHEALAEEPQTRRKKGGKDTDHATDDIYYERYRNNALRRH